MTTPVDLDAVQADDAFLDLISAGHNVHAFDDAELARVLVAWRRDIDSGEFGVLVGTDEAVAVIEAAKPVPRSRAGRVVGAFLRLLGDRR